MKNISFIITLFFIVSLSSFEKISAQPYTIKRLGMEDGLSSNYTQKIIQDQKGYIWVATSSGLNRFDGQKFILYGQDNHKTEQNWINSLLADPTNDNVWVGTDQGLFYFDYPTGSMMPHATPLSHLDKNITGLTAATDSGIWITHYTAGVIHWSAQDTTCYTPQTVLGLKGPFQTAVDDGNGNLYIGHSDKGLSIISIKNNFCKNYRHIPGNQNSLPDNSVNVIYKDKSHNIWLGTNNGLVLFNPQKESFTTFRQMEDNEHSLLGNQVADIKQMNDGTLWISTYLGGVSIFNLLENTFTPPFWLSWYAKLIYALLIILIIYGVSRFYKRKLDLESSLEVERKQSLNKQELNEERLRFYINITHELRTPLTLILGPLEDLLSDATLSPKHANKISIIHDSATRLLNLINRILEFRKTETQNRKLSVVKGDLGQLVQEVGLRYKELNPNNKVNYHIHIETEDTEIFYDADMITIILDNLMSNAAKYTSEGDITLSLRSVEENQIKYTEISVSDTGHGIDAEALPHIFDRYYQAKSKYQASGSGIGLALVKGLSELHEGILKVESTVDAGPHSHCACPPRIRIPTLFIHNMIWKRSRWMQRKPPLPIHQPRIIPLYWW